MITKIKITRLPVRADLKLSAVLVTLDQEMHISEESNLTVDISGRGVPYDDFGYRLGNDNGDWSPEYKATVNGNVNTNTPDIPTVSLTIPTNGTLDITSNIVPNDSTDRIKIVNISPNYGNLVIDGSKAVIGKTYMIYEFINIIFESTAGLESQNAATVINLLPGNKDGDGSAVNINVTTLGNLHSSIFGTATTEGILLQDVSQITLESNWVFVVDGTYLNLGSALSITSATRTELENDGLSSLSNDSEAGPLSALWNPTFNAINPLVDGDAYDVRITFKLETSSGAAGNYVNLDLDIGSGGIGTGPIIWEESKPLLKGANITMALSFSIPIFALPPFFSDDYSSGEGGIFNVTSNVNIDIWDIRIYLIRTHIGD